MKTTITKLTGISLLLVTFLTVSTAIGFARPPKTKKSEAVKEQTLRLTGKVVKVNKDRTFELVSDNGQHYLVRMNRDSSVGNSAPISFQKRVLNFEDLYVGEHVFFRAEQLETTFASTSKPMPVAVR